MGWTLENLAAAGPSLEAFLGRVVLSRHYAQRTVGKSTKIRLDKTLCASLGGELQAAFGMRLEGRALVCLGVLLLRYNKSVRFRREIRLAFRNIKGR